MARVAHRAVAELGEPGEVAQVDVLERRRVGRLAVQQRVGRAARLEHGDALADLGLGGHAGRDHQRRAGCRGVGEQPVVGEVGGRDLQPRDAVAHEGVDARGVPGRAHDVDVDLAAVVEHLEQLLGRQVEPGEQVEGVLRAEVFAGTARAAAVERGHVAQLELHGIRAGGLGLVDELLGEVDRAVVVDADLGDEQGRVVAADVVPADLEGVAAVDRDGDEVAVPVEQRHVVDGADEQPPDLGRRGRGRSAAHAGVGDLGARVGEVDLGLRGDPAAHVAVADRADEVPVLGDAEDDPGLVGADLLERGEHGVLAVDDEGPDAAVDDHAGLPASWASVRSATARSSSVSTSMPSSSSITNSPTRPPMRLSSSS